MTMKLINMTAWMQKLACRDRSNAGSKEDFRKKDNCMRSCRSSPNILCLRHSNDSRTESRNVRLFW